MRLVSILSILVLSISAASFCSTQQKPIEHKKKITIFWSKGGGCHKAMVDALVPMLESTYKITTVNLIEDLLYPVDPVHWITKGKSDGEDVYNYLLSNDWIKTTTLLVEFGKKGVNLRYNKIVALVKEYLEREKPDMVISVIPLFNSHFAAACKELNIPFLLTIMDNVHLYFVAGRPPQNPLEFRCTIPFNDEYWMKNIKKAHVNEATIKGVGFPLRKDFFEKKDIAKIKKEFEIPQNKPVVTILMGGAGSAKCIQYVRKIARMKEPLHVIVCCGRAEQFKAKVEAVKKPENITIKALCFTKRISDLMAASDVLITKSGPASLFEAFQSQVPVLVDRTCGTVPMERMNVQTIIDREFGETISNLRRLPEKINHILNDKDYRAKIKNNMAKASNEHFEKDFKKIIADFFADREKQEASSVSAAIK